MLNVDNSDILAFLEGRASKETRKAIKDWAYAKLDNANELGQTKKVHEASKSLGQYNAVDVDMEWDAFERMTSVEVNTSPSHVDISDSELFRYLDGEVTTLHGERIDDFLSKNKDRAVGIDLARLILTEAPHVAGYIDTDPSYEWALMKTKMSQSEASVIPMPAVRSTTSVHADQPEMVASSGLREVPVSENRTYNSYQEKREASIVPMWMRYAAAAALALLVAVFIWNRSSTPQDAFKTYVTTDSPMEVKLSDGSMVYMGTNSELVAPTSVEKRNERRLKLLKGTAEFDVAEDKTRPFVVEVEGVVGVEALGTRFKVFSPEEFVKAVENIEGTVDFFKLDDRSNNVILKQSDIYGYDGNGFVDMNAPVEDNAKEYNILYVLDYLMKNSSWKVISSPDMPFDEKGFVKIDLDLPIDELLESLREHSDFDYVKLDACDSCYRITSFKEKR